MDQARAEAQLKALTRNFKPPRKNYNRPLLATAAAVLCLPGIYLVDTKLFPVIHNLNFSIYSDAPANETRVSFIFTKRRDCAPVSIEYFKAGDPITAIEVLDNPAIKRYPTGRNMVGPFRLAIERDDFIANGALLMRHRCHPFWLHVSRWFN